MPRQPTDETPGYSNTVDMDGITNFGESGNGRARIAKQEDSGAFDADKGYRSDIRETNHSYVSADFADMGLGYRSVDFHKLVGHMIDVSYWENKQRYLNKCPQKRAEENATARYKRSQRSWLEVRTDSMNRVSAKEFKKFLLMREPEWIYFSDEEKEELDGIDGRSAFQIAQRWRVEQDMAKFNALVTRYAAWLQGREVKVMNQRFRRKPAQRSIAEVVFIADALAVGVTRPEGFDPDALLSRVGDELALKLDTTRTDQERHAWLIHEVEHSFYAKGALFPAFINEGLAEVRDETLPSGSPSEMKPIFTDVGRGI